MCKMWSALCVVSMMALGTQSFQVKNLTPVTPATPAPVVTYHPAVNYHPAAVPGIDPQVLQDVFGAPNTAALAGAAEETSVDRFRPSYVMYDDFDWSLTKRVASVSEQNFLLSPLGLKLALAILTEAATGVTASELQFVLGFDSNSTKVRAKFASILDSLQSKSSQYILELGSRIYVGSSADPRQKFAATAEQHYRTEVRKVDLDKPAAAASEINSWIASITHGRIPSLVSEDDLANVVMMVLNSLYFKGTWRRQFSPNETRLDNFYAGDKVSQVPFMIMEDDFFYAESAKMEAKILRLPYLGEKFSMYLIVPNSIGGLPRVLQQLTGHQLRQEMVYLSRRIVRILLPRFQFEYAAQLDGVLKDLGIRQAFTPAASFPGIARGEKLQETIQISKVMQKSGIELNELGSVVYTATQVTLVNRFGSDESAVEVNANKPFLFFIEDESTRQLLFTGRISNPAAPTGAFL